MNHKINNIERLEIELLIEALYRCYGYDFRNYSYNSVRRRVLHRVKVNSLNSIAELQHSLLYDETVADVLIGDLSINVTEMFRDPLFYSALHEQVLPLLVDYEHLKIWHAGCASGEEVYSMAILLSEAGMYGNSQFYATDFNDNILDKAKNGVFPLDQMRNYVRNYQAAGGKQQFSNYYHARYDGAVINGTLKKNILFAHHNLTTDASFGEMQMVVCRNVLIYFNRELQESVLNLFAESLCTGGILCLGSHETIQLSSVATKFETISDKQRIYKKM